MSRLTERQIISLGYAYRSSLVTFEPVRRYERENPGELIHIDIKKLGRFEQIGHRVTGDRTGQSNGRGAGWEYAHVCIDDASRVAFSQTLPNEKKESAVAFLKAAVASYASLGVVAQRVMTDNGACYKSFAFRDASAMPAATSVCDTSERSHTPLRPTGRPSGSSRPPCENGPTPRHTRTRSDAPLSCRSGCTDTTGIGRTAQ